MRRGIGLGAALALLYKEAETKNEASFFQLEKLAFFTRPRGRQMMGGILQIRKSRHSFQNNGFFWYSVNI